MENPFDDSYCRNEIKKLNCPEIEYGNVKIKKLNIEGRCDDFLNVNFRHGETAIEGCPLFMKDGKVWMSLTPMEIQSQYLPIKHGMANKRIATVGLGIGYFTVMVMASNTVESIDIYEIDETVIDVFTKNFSEREGFEKLNFIVGDFRDTLKNKEYDFVYLDPYLDLLPDEMIDDYVNVKSNNKIKLLRPWGVELCFANSEECPKDIKDFLSMHKSKLRSGYYDAEFNENMIEEIGVYERFL